MLFSDYLERFITVVPDLEIYSAYEKDGNFVFDGYYPTKVEITNK